ncbi:hypothetical protein BDW59DRAFT_177809 [Aspergillus cavernicola]|uniref:Capsule polysaccharide biosynthesis protein n=1 Tax=Aspergillus cavernicola TaxID=176166 RepID=A0ABR4HHC0_9EURO
MTSGHDFITPSSPGKYQPVTSERNIWAFWHSGLRSMPSWCQRNVTNWARVNGTTWTIRVLDNINNSPNNVERFLSDDMIPPHSADLIRGACLYIHGESPTTPVEMSVMHMGGTGISNHFIAARKQSPFMEHLHDLFAYLWKDRTSCKGVSKHALLAPVLNGGKFHGDEGTNYFGWEHKCEPDAIMDYGAHILAWQRLVMLEDGGDGFSGVDYFRHKVLLLDVIEESWRAESLLGWRGSDLFNALSTRLDDAPESEEIQTAFKAVMTTLAESSMQNIYRGKEMLKYSALGTLWDEKENEGKDQEAGTLVELVRYGSVHYEQTRDIVPVETPRPPVVLSKGLLEI